MGVGDLVRTSLSQLHRQKRRYTNPLIILTLALGGVLTMLSVGDPVLRRISHGLDLLAGATLIKATWDFRSDSTHRVGYSQKDLDAIGALEGVQSVSPVVSLANTTIHFGNRRTTGSVYGVDADFFLTVRMHVKAGRPITQADVSAGKNVAVVGQTIAAELFPPTEHVPGGPLVLGGQSVSVVGRIGGLEEREFLEAAIVPISFARHRIAGMDEIREIYLRSVDWEAAPFVRDRVFEVLSTNHPESAQVITVNCFPKRIEKIRSVIGLVRWFIVVALTIVAIVGGASIANCMSNAVQDRTTEVGLRMALGATEKDIQTQFLLEALSVSLTGTMLGVISSLFVTGSIEWFWGIAPDKQALWAGLATAPVFGIVVGIVSGWIPAAMAGRLNPVDAMRFE